MSKLVSHVQLVLPLAILLVVPAIREAHAWNGGIPGDSANPQSQAVSVAPWSSASLGVQTYTKARQGTAAGPSALAVVGGNVSPGSAVNSIQFDAGTINLNSSTKTEHTFKLRNTSSATVTLTRVHPSCGCLTASVSGQDMPGQTNAPQQPSADFTPITLAPGE